MALYAPDGDQSFGIIMTNCSKPRRASRDELSRAMIYSADIAPAIRAVKSQLLILLGVTQMATSWSIFERSDFARLLAGSML